MNANATFPLRVAGLAIDPVRRRIAGPGGEVALEPLVTRLLLQLVERQGEVIRAASSSTNYGGRRRSATTASTAWFAVSERRSNAPVKAGCWSRRFRASVIGWSPRRMRTARRRSRGGRWWRWARRWRFWSAERGCGALSRAPG